MLTLQEIFREKPVIIAGPCAVESYDQIIETAKHLHETGVSIMRCQLWKPRTSKESFQGVGLAGLPWLKEIKEKYNMLIATEILDAENIEATKGFVDILWVGARNMQNFELLKKISNDNRPVVLKRGFIATIEEWIASGKYIGLERVVFCERGIRTGVDSMRFTMDLNGALVMKHDHNFHVIIDPSHPAGRADMVPYLSYAAIAAGLDGLIIETHIHPENALSDKEQQITIDVFKEVFEKIKQIKSIL